MINWYKHFCRKKQQQCSWLFLYFLHLWCGSLQKKGCFSVVVVLSSLCNVTVLQASCQASTRLCTLQPNMPPRNISLLPQGWWAFRCLRAECGASHHQLPRQVTNRQERDGNEQVEDGIAPSQKSNESSNEKYWCHQTQAVWQCATSLSPIDFQTKSLQGAE